MPNEYANLVKATPGLLGYWRLNETSGTVANDSSGFGHNGTIKGSCKLKEPGPLSGDGYSIKFPGVSASWISVPTATSFHVAHPSVEAWIWEDEHKAEGSAVTSNEAGVSESVGFALGNQVSVSNAMAFHEYQSTIWTEAIGTTSNLGEWNHFAGVYDGEALRLFKNGVEVATTAFAGTLGYTATGLQIGKNWAAVQFNGRIAEVAVYGEPHTAITWKQHYEARTPPGYDVTLGPVRFTCPIEPVGETIGDGVEIAGQALLAGERKPRPKKLKLPVRGDVSEANVQAAGNRLRRQLRQMFDNAALRLQGFYFLWALDEDHDGWLIIGSGTLEENNWGVLEGEYDLELNDVYLAGRAGTHRPARRMDVFDLRKGLAARDSRRLLYSTDFEAQALPEQKAILPGDATNIVVSNANPTGTVVAGHERNGRKFWQSIAEGFNGEVLAYQPNPSVLSGRRRFLELDEVGNVTVWDATAAPTPTFSEVGDEESALYGWEAMFGPPLTENKVLAMENGVCRVLWLGAAASQGLAIEYWDTSIKRYRRIGRVLHALNVTEARVIECTPERSILEWRAGPKAMRAILQRGWWGPRLESYNDDWVSATAVLEFVPTGSGAVTLKTETPTWVRSIKAATEGFLQMWASGSEGETVNTTLTVASGSGAKWSRARVLVATLSPPPGLAAGALASFSLLDSRPVPVLVSV